MKVVSNRTVRELKRVEPRHQCLDCGYVASYKSQLVDHSRSHSGDRPFSCELCDQKFSHKGHVHVAHIIYHQLSLQRDRED